jgi:hypothetical protein
MAAPLVPLLALVAAAVGLALASKKSAATAPGSPGAAPAPSAIPGIPSFPGASGVLNGVASGTITTAPTAPPPVMTLPPITISNPAPPVFTSPAPAPPIASPPALDQGGNPVITVPPVTIVGSDGTSGSTAPWDASTMVLPDPSSLPAIPSKYQAKGQETVDEQNAINSWAAAVGFQAIDAKGANLIPLATDGRYGPDTQLAMAGFQVYANATRNAGLSVDGLGGPNTQTYLLDWGDITSGAY